MPAREQGQIWWANLPRPLGQRPVLILTRNDAIPKLHSVTVAPLTRTIRGISSEVIVGPADGVPYRSAATLDNIATIEQDLLLHLIAELPSERMDEVWDALHFAFDLPF